MSATSAATSSANGLAGTLAGQLDAATELMIGNNWVTKPQLENIKVRAANIQSPVPTSGRSLLAQFLLDQRLMPRDQVADLDAIIRNQATLPDFVLQKKIGAGGMGTVFLALHRTSQRLVALKTINARLADDKDFVERFHREARALEKVHHQNIAEIIGCGETEGTCWLAMEYIEGPSLMSLLKEHRVLPEHYALNLTRQIAEGLGHVWDKAGLVHRDIKPENVLVIRTRSGDELFPSTDVAKLIDFGLVKSNSDDDRLTQTGMTIGTPLYMSPEQVRGEKLDCRSDIYGVGATLYHLLTGQTPFNGNSPGAIMSAHLTEQVPDPGDRVPSLSKLTRHLVMGSMAKSVDKRFLTFEALIAACNEALEGLDHKSTSVPRLLRKPMVLKNPVKRSGEYTADGQDVNAPTPRPTSRPTPPQTPAQPPTPASGRQAVPNQPVTSSFQRPRTDQPAPPASVGSASQASAATAQAPDRNAPTVVTPSTKPATGFVQSTAPNARPQTRPVGAPLSTRSPAVGTASAIKITGTESADRASVSTSTSDILQPQTSAAYVEPPQSPGTGLLPWLVLGFAVLALGAFLAISYL